MNLGENIYRYRTEQNMSQGDLADALEVSRQSISKWENNMAVPELEKLVKMSHLFGISLDELVSGEQSASKIPYTQNILPTRNTMGAILLCASILIFLLFALFSTHTAALLYALPFAVCGVVCLAFPRHTGVWCVWGLYFLFFIIFPQIIGMLVPLSFYLDSATVNILLIQIPIVIYTVHSFRRDKISPSINTIILIVLGILIYAAYLALRVYDTIADPAWRIWRIAVYCNPIHFALFTALFTTFCRFERGK